MAVFDESTRLQVLLQRVKTGLVRDTTNRVGEDLSELLSGVLANAEVSRMTPSRLDEFLESLSRRVAEAIDNGWIELLPQLRDLARDMAEAEAEILEVESPDLRSVPRRALESEVLADGVPAPLLAGIFVALVESQVRQIRMGIRTLARRGQTNDQIRTAVVGSSSRRNRGALVGRVRSRVGAFADLAGQHVAESSREIVWMEQAGVRRVRWTVILDSRTCQQCAPLDGQIFAVREGPRAPLHPRCRCFRVALTEEEVDRSRGVRPSASGEVPAELTYYAWLKRQPTEFQNAAIGPTRARLLRSGGLSADEFRRLQLDRNFEPLTLEEMRALRPLAFRRAGLETETT